MQMNWTTHYGKLLFATVFLAASTLLQAQPLLEEKPKTEVPPTDIGATTLESRKQAQMNTVDQFKVFYDFQFSDRLTESGITFLHRMVDDAGKHYMQIHYDHGNGISTADVDGDGLQDIYFVNQLGSNELWKNLGKGKFENITSQAGVAMENRISVTASFGDIDNDGDQDLFVTTVRKGNSLFENDGKGRFTDVTKQKGVDYSGHSSSAIFVDYDLDGWLDLFLTNVGKYSTDRQGRGGYYVGIKDGFHGHLKPELDEPNILYKNDGGKRFIDVSRKAGVTGRIWSGDASFADLNNDRYPDLYVVNMQGDDRFYENVKGQTFVEKTVQYFPKTPWGTMGIKFFDYNNDGLLDLLLTDMHSDMAKPIGPEDEKKKSVVRWDPKVIQGGENNIFGNAFYKNLGNGKFQELSDELGLENYWPWGVSVDDVNADGYEDVLITSSMNFPYRYGVNSLLLNNKGEKFLDSEFILGIEPRKDGRTKTHWFDIDCGGEDKGNPMCGPQTIAFSVMANLGTRSAAIFDVENDGDLDIVTNEYNSEPQVLMSNLSEKREVHYLKLQLSGTKSNRNGIGALVTVTAGGRSQTKLNDGKSGYLSQSVMPLYFGLGDAKEVEKIEIAWPSGIKQVVEKPAINTILKIEEPEN
jgi:enediyne biosynthesis protein E4